jgi:hypothetical protein
MHCAAPRDNQNDPLSTVYKNEPPRIGLTVSYDSIAAFKPTSNDTHWVVSATPVTVAATLSDDYQLYGAPTLQWALVSGGVDTLLDDTTTTIEFVPPFEGVFILLLSATDNEGAIFSDSVFFITRAVDNIPINTFALSLSTHSGEAPLRVAFSITAPDSNTAHFRYKWDFGDGTRIPTILPSADFTYYRPGVFPIQVQVRNMRGQQATLFDTVTVLRQRKASWPLWLYDVTATPTVITVGDSALLRVSYDTTLNPPPTISWYIGNKSIVGNPVRYRFKEAGEVTAVARIKHVQGFEIFESAFLYVRPHNFEHLPGWSAEP